MDAAILLPPTRTPMSGIAFAKRLPSGEVNNTHFIIGNKINKTSVHQCITVNY